MSLTVTPTVPTTSVSMRSIMTAFPGLSGNSNHISLYYGRYPYMSSNTATQSIAFGDFKGICALTPSFGALSNAPAAPNLNNLSFNNPVSGTNAVLLAGGFVAGMVGGSASYTASLAFNLFNYLDNNNFNLGTGQCTFSIQSGTLPTGVTLSSASNGTLTISATTASSQDQTVVFRCTNFYGNYNTATIKFNLNPALYYGGALAIYNGESFCPATQQWADITGSGRTATAGGGSLALSTMNARTVLTGTTASTVTWPAGVLPSTYSLIHIAKYNGATKQRILTSSDGVDWLSGHWSGSSGVAKHSGWVGGSVDYGGGANWILSSDQNSLYRVNGIAQGSGGGGTSCKLGINTYGAETSQWAVALVAVYPSALTGAQLYNIEKSLASQYGIAWLSGSIGNTTLGNNAYAVNLTDVFQNCSSYAIPTNPNSSTSVSGSTSTTTGAYRNTSYAVTVSGTAANGSVSYCQYTVVENQQPPYVASTPETQVLTSGGSLGISVNFGGPGLWYGVGGGYATLSGSTLSFSAANRNTSYTVTIYAYNTRYDGGNQQSASTSFTVFENQQPPNVISTLGTQSDMGGYGYYCPNYIGLGNGNSKSYSCSGGYASVSGSYLYANTAYRNTAYTINMYGNNYRYDGQNLQQAVISFTMYESQTQPSNNGYGNQTTASPTGNNDYYVTFNLGNGSSAQYSVNSNHPNWQSLGSGIRIWANYRNTTYWVTISATTYRFDGQSAKSTSCTFYVTEPVIPYPKPTYNHGSGYNPGWDINVGWNTVYMNPPNADLFSGYTSIYVSYFVGAYNVANASIVNNAYLSIYYGGGWDGYGQTITITASNAGGSISTNVWIVVHG